MAAEDVPAARVLVVDDDAEVRHTMGLMLEAFGYGVLPAASGPDALACARETRVDLLLTDIQMPDMDGHALAEAFAAEHPDVPILFVSGYADERPALGPRRGFLAKPLSLDSFVATVTALLRSR